MFFSNSLHNLLTRLTDNGFSAFAVGGAVRDILMGNKPSDQDIATSAKPLEIKKVFRDYKTVDTGIKFGTVTVIIGKECYEITTFRTEEEYKDFRHPDSLRFSDKIEDDLSRRDFTMNAMAMDVNGTVLDFYGGRRDIEKKLIRAVGDPNKRFSEDPLRILRGVRFCATMGFSAEVNTKKAMTENACLLKNISCERKTEEILKILTAPYFHKAATEFLEIFKELFPSFNSKMAERVNGLPEKLSVRLAALLERECDIEFLRLSRELKKQVEIIKNSEKEINADEKELKALYLKYGENLYDILCFRAPLTVELFLKIKGENGFLSRDALNFKGEDFMRKGIYGKEIKKESEKLLLAVMEGRIKNDKKAIEKYLSENKNNA